MNKVNVQDKINNAGKTKLDELMGGFIYYLFIFCGHEYNFRMIGDFFSSNFRLQVV